MSSSSVMFFRIITDHFLRAADFLMRSSVSQRNSEFISEGYKFTLHKLLQFVSTKYFFFVVFIENEFGIKLIHLELVHG